jgi:hypothetical protein
MPAGFHAMRDLPAGPTLLALARDVLLNDLMPLLPPGSRLDVRLVANSMAIAEREVGAGETPLRDIAVQVQNLLGENSDLDRSTRYSAAREPTIADPLRRFASALRTGAFEGSQQRDREARAILWRLTLAKLRQANPRFLTANGLG